MDTTYIENPILERLMDSADVNHKQRHELRANPVLAIELLQIALRRPGVKKPAAYALARFRAKNMQREPSLAAELAIANEPELVPTPELLERAREWKLPAEAVAAIEDAIAQRAAA